MSLEGKSAIVTGAGRGIGRAITTRLAREGVFVYCVDINDEDLRATRESCACEGRIASVNLDVTARESVDSLIARVVEERGGLDICINNAGINLDAMIHKMTDEQWDRVFSVDLTGVFYMTRAASDTMRQKGSGRIVNVSSASWMGNIGQANYSAAKAGVVGLTLTAARELGRYNVTANAICPGFIDTEMTRGLPPKVYDAQIQKIPPGRPGSPEEVANLVALLSSDEAAYMTGEVINIGGGYRI